MRSHILLVILILGLSQNIFALHQPDPNVTADKELLDNIQLAIDMGRLKQKEVASLQTLRRNINNSTAANQEIDGNIQRAKAVRDAHFSRAAHLTIDLYQLTPKNSTGISVMPGMEGRAVEWIIIAGEPAIRTVMDSNNNPVEIEPPAQSKAGSTYFDGVSIIAPRTFSHSIAYLASTIYHESIHFTQHTTKGVGDKLSDNEREIDACAKEMYLANWFGLTTAEMEEIQKAINDNSAAANARRGSRGADHKDSSDDYYTAHNEDELKAIKERSAEIDRSIAQEQTERTARLEEAHRQREQQDAVTEWWTQLIAEARKCNFEPRDLSQGAFEDRDRSMSGVLRFRMHGDINVMKARFMVARACTRDMYLFKQPCNDSLDTLRQEWSSPGFRNGVTLRDGVSSTWNCLIYMTERLKRPKDVQGFVNYVNKYWEADRQAEIYEMVRNARERNRQEQQPYESQPRERPTSRDCLFGNCVDLPSRISVPSLSY